MCLKQQAVFAASLYRNQHAALLCALRHEAQHLKALLHPPCRTLRIAGRAVYAYKLNGLIRRVIGIRIFKFHFSASVDLVLLYCITKGPPGGQPFEISLFDYFASALALRSLARAESML